MHGPTVVPAYLQEGEVLVLVNLHSQDRVARGLSQPPQAHLGIEEVHHGLLQREQETGRGGEGRWREEGKGERGRHRGFGYKGRGIGREKVGGEGTVEHGWEHRDQQQGQTQEGHERKGRRPQQRRPGDRWEVWKKVRKHRKKKKHGTEQGDRTHEKRNIP